MVCGDEGIAEVFKQCSDLFGRILIFQICDGIVNIQGDQLNTSIFQFLIVDTVNAGKRQGRSISETNHANLRTSGSPVGTCPQGIFLWVMGEGRSELSGKQPAFLFVNFGVLF